MHCPYFEERKVMVQKIVNQLGNKNILEKLEDFAIIQDWKKKGVWPTAKKSWEFCLSTNATHHIVIQDDCIICKDFIDSIQKCIETFPDRIISLYANRKICEDAKNKDIRWIQMNDGMWGNATLFPTNILKDFLVWQQKHLDQKYFMDDSRYRIFCMMTKNYPLVTMPSFVDHGLPSDSCVGHNNKKRIARWFEKDKSYLEYDWSNKQMLYSNTTQMFTKDWRKYYYE